MNPSPPQDDVPVIDAETGSQYSLEILSEITGVSRQTILLYQEQGILRPAQPDATRFDEETLHALRRIEHLRNTCEMNLGGLKLLASLLDEVEHLRTELRARR